MAIKKEWVVNCHYQSDGKTIQEVVEQYFMIYFENEIKKQENHHGGLL